MAAARKTFQCNAPGNPARLRSSPLALFPDLTRSFTVSCPQVDVVGLNLRIQRHGIHAQQARGAGLVAAGLIEGAPD